MYPPRRYWERPSQSSPTPACLTSDRCSLWRKYSGHNSHHELWRRCESWECLVWVSCSTREVWIVPGTRTTEKYSRSYHKTTVNECMITTRAEAPVEQHTRKSETFLFSGKVKMKCIKNMLHDNFRESVIILHWNSSGKQNFRRLYMHIVNTNLLQTRVHAASRVEGKNDFYWTTTSMKTVLDSLQQSWQYCPIL